MSSVYEQTLKAHICSALNMIPKHTYHLGLQDLMHYDIRNVSVPEEVASVVGGLYGTTDSPHLIQDNGYSWKYNIQSIFYDYQSSEICRYLMIMPQVKQSKHIQ